MIYSKWLALCLADWLLLLTLPIAAPIVAAFTRAEQFGYDNYSWGWIWGTYDNPPQGDEGFVRKRAPFKGLITGWQGYVNRVAWMIRNPLYGFAKIAGVKYDPQYALEFSGNPDISDKYKISGFYFATLKDNGKLVAFELYAVLPYGFGRCVRARLGWKIMTDKFERYGFGQFVNTFNPFDGYGD
jgi:hypothetical protein